MERYSHTLVRLAISGTDIGCRHTSASDIDFAECVEWAAYPILGFKVSRSQVFAGRLGSRPPFVALSDKRKSGWDQVLEKNNTGRHQG